MVYGVYTGIINYDEHTVTGVARTQEKNVQLY